MRAGSFRANVSQVGESTGFFRCVRRRPRRRAVVEVPDFVDALGELSSRRVCAGSGRRRRRRNRLRTRRPVFRYSHPISPSRLGLGQHPRVRRVAAHVTHAHNCPQTAFPNALPTADGLARAGRRRHRGPLASPGRCAARPGRVIMCRCVEVGNTVEMIAIRDSTDPHGPMLAFGAKDWQRFTDQVKAGPDTTQA
jgi:hypothetical protein